MKRHGLRRPSDQVTITQEQHRLCRARVTFLLAAENAPGEIKLIDLLANTYHQGLVDAVQVMDKRGWIQPPNTAAAQQDRWP